MIHDPPSKMLSIVIAASNGPGELARTLESLRGQAEFPDTEVIAVCNFDIRAERGLKEEFPFAKFVAQAGDATVPELRYWGIELATGEVIALTEDYGLADEHWCEEIKKARESNFSVVGGAVENRTPNTLLNWAVYFFDYGKYMPPLREGITKTLSGINVCYRRGALQELEENFRGGFDETVVHQDLIKRGGTLYLAPAAIVYLSKDFRFGGTFRNFFSLAKSFASKRVARHSLPTRTFLVAGSVALPIVLPVRVALRILPKRRHLLELVLCFPLLVILMTSWAAGEFCGYLGAETTREDKTV